MKAKYNARKREVDQEIEEIKQINVSAVNNWKKYRDRYEKFNQN